MTIQKQGRWLLLALSLLLGFLPSSFVLAQSNNKDQTLEQIQREIKNKQAALERKIASAEQLQDQLRDAELNIAEQSKAVVITARQIKDGEKEQARLNKEYRQLDRQNQQQQGLLSKQVLSAFMTGQHDYTKMLLAQEDAGRFERTLVYYQYLNKARQEQLDKVQGLLQEVAAVERQVADQQAKLEELHQQQIGQRQKLQRQQQNREKTLSQIRRTIDNEAAQIEQLRRNERNLGRVIAKAVEQQEQNAKTPPPPPKPKVQERPKSSSKSAPRRQSVPVRLTGLRSMRGKLPVPAKGRVRKLFGAKRQGQVRWKGIVINANSGTSVSAIQDGKILYADWLKGFGLVVVMDHGNGYMSLYGHNQALLKQVGDSVRQGETIALVGQSGGQSRPSLYFEIRHKGKAINPSRWLRL